MNVNDPKIMRYTHAPAFLCRMRTHQKVDFSHDIPDLTGSSKDRATIYVDRSVKRFFRSKDIFKFLLVFEKAKTALKDLYGLDQQNAHAIATFAMEVPAVIKAGIKWEDYERFLAPQIKSVRKVNNVPADLDISGYDNADQEVLKGRIKRKDGNDIHQRRLSKLQDRKAAANV